MRHFIAISLLLAIPACGDDVAGDGNEGEVITAVELTFTPEAGGAPIVALWNDADGDGGEPPVIDPIALEPGSYDLAVVLENRLEEPPEDITAEVADEADEHQIFFTGSAVGEVLAHSYADEDSAGLPIGLASTVVAATGTGELTVTLRHLPPINDAAVKTEGLADEVAGGFADIPGETDAQVTFEVTVGAATVR